MEGAISQRDRLSTTLTEDGRYRLLIEAVTRLCHLHARPRRHCLKLESRRRTLQRLHSRAKSSASISPGSTPKKTVRPGCRRGRWKPPARGQIRERRMACTQGWPPILGLRRHRPDPRRRPANSSAIAKITRDLTERKAPSRRSRQAKSSFGSCSGRHRLRHLHARRSKAVTSWNLGAERIKGYVPREIIGKHFSNFYTEEDRARVSRSRPLRPQDGRADLRRKAGGSVKMGRGFGRTSSLTPSATDDGKIVGIRENHAGHHRAQGSSAEA